MCEATAYLLKNGQEELILKDVDVIEPDGDSVRIVNIFGEQKVVKAEIHSLNLINHKVLLVEKITSFRFVGKSYDRGKLRSDHVHKPEVGWAMPILPFVYDTPSVSGDYAKSGLNESNESGSSESKRRHGLSTLPLLTNHV